MEVYQVLEDSQQNYHYHYRKGGYSKGYPKKNYYNKVTP